MDTTILPAFIALAGVVISVLISFASTRLTVRNEIEKLESSIVQSFSESILEERKNRYPRIYFEISQMSKRLQSHSFEVGRPKIDAKSFQEFVFRLDDLNSENSVFFSSAAGSVSSQLRIFNYELLTELLKNEKGIDEILNEERMKEFKNKIGNLEVALKKDLGVFIIEFHDPKNTTSKMSYSELRALREQRNNKNK